MLILIFQKEWDTHLKICKHIRSNFILSIKQSQPSCCSNIAFDFQSVTLVLYIRGDTSQTEHTSKPLKNSLSISHSRKATMPLCSPSMPGKPSLLDRALHDIEDNLSILYCVHLSCSQLFRMLDEGKSDSENSVFILYDAKFMIRVLSVM